MQCATFLQFFIILCSSFHILCSNFGDHSNNRSNLIDDTYFRGLDGRIVNGSKAEAGQFPHQVALIRSYNGQFFCGGNVIHDRWILTAAHCLYKRRTIPIPPTTIKVVAGKISLAQLTVTDDRSQERRVQAIIRHPKYDWKTYANDVALLKLTTALELNSNLVKAAKLQKKIPKPETVCEVSGWGYLNENIPTTSDDLMYIPVPIIKPGHCRKLLANYTDLPPGMFCAGYEEGLQDACQGDSGGGMICEGRLTGLVSTGEGCARPRLPGVYTDVAHYRDWIEQAMLSYEESANGNTEHSGPKWGDQTSHDLKAYNGSWNATGWNSTHPNNTHWNQTGWNKPKCPHGSAKCKSNSEILHSSLALYAMVISFSFSVIYNSS